jgi:hypothetical protein
MPRFLAAGLALLLASPAAALAQRVRLEVVPDTSSPPLPLVRTPGILRDARWSESLQSSLPVRMRFRVEIWRIRTDWFDALERSFEWETVLEYEPLTDQYVKTEIWNQQPRRVERFETLAALETHLEAGTRILLRPQGTGQYYYTASLNIRTLTDAELDELERFLRGTDDPPRRTLLGRAMRGLLLRFGGMPSDQLETRSRRFSVPPAP